MKRERVLVRTFVVDNARVCEECGRSTADLPGCTETPNGMTFHVVYEDLLTTFAPEEGA